MHSTIADDTVPALAPGAVRRCVITDAPLDPAAVLAEIADPAVGGESLFVGVVRDHDPHAGARRVVTLDYEAHPDAEAALAAVAERAAAFPGVRLVAVEHRTGSLPVGAAAVVVAVGAEHRGEAFDACRFLIDTLKAEVPIWKRQRYADGTSDWVGCA